MRVCPKCFEVYGNDAGFCPHDGTPLSGSDDQYLGRTIASRYRLIKRLGSGGMSLVYLARHVIIDRLSAIKILRPDFGTSPAYRERFLREARAVNRINHANIVEISDVGEADGVAYLVMEYVSGESLLALIQRAALPWPRALRIGVQIAGALGRTHELGVIHRDLKPENVMLTEREGNPDFVKVLDFGIAKIGMDAEPTGPTSRPLTRVGTIMGTPNYMSPEQAVGQPCDARADVYALGVVFYEMLVGEALFDGDPVMVLAAHVTSPPPPLPASVQDALGPRSDEILQKMLAKSQEARFQTAVELQTALQELDSGLSPTPASVVGPSPKPGSVVVATQSTQHAAQAVTAATQLAESIEPASVAAQIAVLRAPEGAPLEAPPVDRQRRMVLGAALAAAAVGVLVLLVFAFRGPTSADEARGGGGSTTSATSPSANDGDEELPPLSSGREITKATPPAASAAEDSKTEGDAGAKAGSGGGGGNNNKKGGKKGPLDGVIKPLKKWF